MKLRALCGDWGSDIILVNIKSVFFNVYNFMHLTIIIKINETYEYVILIVYY